jgi:hypothetical protein
MLGRGDHGFVDIGVIVLTAAIRRPILADPEACCFVTWIALCWSFP